MQCCIVIDHMNLLVLKVCVVNDSHLIPGYLSYWDKMAPVCGLTSAPSPQTGPPIHH